VKDEIFFHTDFRDKRAEAYLAGTHSSRANRTTCKLH